MQRAGFIPSLHVKKAQRQTAHFQMGYGSQNIPCGFVVNTEELLKETLLGDYTEY